MKGFLAVLALYLAYLVVGCGDEGLRLEFPDGATGFPTGGSGSVTITIPNGASTNPASVFGATPITITVGSSVTWLNNDSVAHTVTSVNGRFDSGRINPGGSFSTSFFSAGTFGYVCTLHSGETGNIQVLSTGTGAGPLPQPTPTGIPAPFPTPTPTVNPTPPF